MSSEQRRSRRFHRYHHVQNQREENRDGGGDGFMLTPTRRATYVSSKRSSASKLVTGAILGRNEPSGSSDQVIDDLTLGYHESSPSHRNPPEYAVSPTSARSFRIISLDGCHEEQVSPLQTDASSATSSHRMLRDVPTIPTPPRDYARKKPKSTRRKPKTEALRKSFSADSYDLPRSKKKEDATYITPPSTMRRRRSSHSRSQFVFDGNLCFGAISPAPAYVPSPTLAYGSPPPRISFPGVMVMNYPPPPTTTTPMSMSPVSPMMPLPITPMSPPHSYSYSPPHSYTFDDRSTAKDHSRKEGRRTPPPSHQEQRRRNRAMPSVQYDDILFRQRTW